MRVRQSHNAPLAMTIVGGSCHAALGCLALRKRGKRTICLKTRTIVCLLENTSIGFVNDVRHTAAGMRNRKGHRALCEGFVGNISAYPSFRTR